MLKTSIWKHFAAFIYDIFPMLGLLLLTSLLILLARSGEEVEQHSLWFDLLVFSEIAFYYIYSWKVGGQTIGMRAWKIKIFSRNGSLTWASMSIRFFIGIISTLLLGLGIFWKLFSKDKLTWMDIVSHSETKFVDT